MIGSAVGTQHEQRGKLMVLGNKIYCAESSCREHDSESESERLSLTEWMHTPDICQTKWASCKDAVQGISHDSASGAFIAK